MSIQHLNDVKTVARTAEQIGAPLPEKITHALAHLDDIVRNAPTMPQPGLIARELAQHIGDPVKMDKALKSAATDLAAADAAIKIHRHLAETCGTRVKGMMAGHAEQITTSFGHALEPDLATLRATAIRLPAWFTEEQAASLDAPTFEAWTQARDAYARIQTASAALSPFYAAAISQDNRSQFPVTAAAALRFAVPPKFTDARHAYSFRDALAGRTERVQGLAGQGSTFVDGLFIPTALAHVGATFEWATPAEVTERSGRTARALTPQMAA